MIEWLKAIWGVFTEDEPEQVDRVSQWELDQATGRLCIEDAARRFLSAESRRVNAGLWSTQVDLLADYLASNMSDVRLARAWAYNRSHADAVALWRGRGIGPLRMCASIDENERVS